MQTSTIAWTDIKFILIIFLIFRAVHFGIALLVISENEPQSSIESNPVYQTYNHPIRDKNRISDVIVNSWYRWDTGYFLKIAADGYHTEDGSTAYAPFYPLLIWLISQLFGRNYLLSALLISNFFCLTALILLYEVTVIESSSKIIARRAVVYTLVFPTGFYLVAGYPESLFLTLLLLSWILVRNHRWLLAGLIACLATLSRFQGITTSVLVLVSWISIIVEKLIDFASYSSCNRKPFWNLIPLKKNFLPKSLIVGCAFILPSIILFSYTCILRYYGLNNMLSTYSNNWNNPLVDPITGIRLITNRIIYGNLNMNDWVNIGAFILFLILSIKSFTILKPALAFYSVITFLLISSISLGILYNNPIDGPIFLSLIRYSTTLFPLFIVLAMLITNKWIDYLIVIIFTIFQLLFVWLFINWYWVA